MMKKKVTTLVAASLAALTLLAGCGSNGTADKKDGAAKGDKTLIVGTEPTFPPFEFTENEKDVGFDIDLAQAVCDKLGYKMEVKNLGFDALIPALKSGQIDLIAAGMDATDERKKQIDFTDVYYQGGYTIVVPTGNTDITGYDSIAGKTVGAQVGSKAADYAREHGANVKEFDTNTQGWMELEAGTCDAVSIDKAVAQYYLQQGGKDKLKIVGEPITSRGVAMGISKDKPELSKQVNEALKEIKADGTYAKIYKKWFGEERKKKKKAAAFAAPFFALQGAPRGRPAGYSAMRSPGWKIPHIPDGLATCEPLQ